MILVFGQTGQVARELAYISQRNRVQIIQLGRNRVDLSYPQSCFEAIAAHAPTAVINAAAYTAVDQAEQEEALAHTINADAPGAMARSCAMRNIPFLHISTDYVFDGNGTQAWRETDSVSPQNAYGRTKLAGEQQIAAAGGHAAILRTSWVFSAHGTNFVKTMLRLAKTRTDLTVVDDQIGCPTPARAIADTLLSMADRMSAGQGGGTYHFGGQPPVSWAEFAQYVFDIAEKSVAVTGIPSADYPKPAARPLNARLNCSKLLAEFGIAPPDWKAGVATVIRELEKV